MLLKRVWTVAEETPAIPASELFGRDAHTGELPGVFVGRPYSLDYERALVLVADAWKAQAKGIPQGSFLLAYYENEEEISEALLLRVLKPARLPTDNDAIGSMIEYYRENLSSWSKASHLDSFTQSPIAFSGIDCRILGTFYKDRDGQLRFGADVENFYSAHHYAVVKPKPHILDRIVNFREKGNLQPGTEIRIGEVRYTSSRRFQSKDGSVPVFVNARDFMGNRTALFGMTRTGKSNTVKKIIQATVGLNSYAPLTLKGLGATAENILPFTPDGMPVFPVGQIIFDVNGEYANANLQDEGTAVYEMFRDQVTRYSTINKAGFKVMKVNFYREMLSGFDLVRSHLSQYPGAYIESVCAIDLTPPRIPQPDFSAQTRHERKVAAYLCCLYKAGFPPPAGFKVHFPGNERLNRLVKEGGLDPSKGISLEDATNWFTAVWDRYESDAFFASYKRKHGHEWADEDLKALLVFLTRKRSPGANVGVDGYIKLRGIVDLHTDVSDRPFEEQIIQELRRGRIIIVDLSQGDAEVQRLYSERICRQVFADALDRFIQNLPNNFIQFYFEEAHTLFPRKEDKDLNQIYNKIAKEGAKLNLGLVYATQEVSSISANILKNTQNWFITHLNNEEELRELRKYYDFGDFTESLVHYSATSDRGFVRMKTYSNPFVVPVQVDLFSSEIVR